MRWGEAGIEFVCCSVAGLLRRTGPTAVGLCAQAEGRANCPSPGGWSLLALPIISADAPGRTARPKFFFPLRQSTRDQRPGSGQCPNPRREYILLEDLTLSQRDRSLILEDFLYFILYLVFYIVRYISLFYFRGSYLIFSSDRPPSS